MTGRRWTLTAVAWLAATTPAGARQAPPAAIDPAMGYLMVRLGERAAGQWNVLSVAPYDPVREDISGKGRAAANPTGAGGPDRVVIGDKAPVAEDGHIRTYMVAVRPGRYVLQGGASTCFCLGSYQFDAAAGRITDLGTVHIGLENGTSPWAQLRGLRSSADIEARGYTVAEAMTVIPMRPTSRVPAALAAMPREGARYLPAARFGNHEGQLPNRALPMEGER